jgi:hypothetical protein
MFKTKQNRAKVKSEHEVQQENNYKHVNCDSVHVTAGHDICDGRTVHLVSEDGVSIRIQGLLDGNHTRIRSACAHHIQHI